MCCEFSELLWLSSIEIEKETDRDREREKVGGRERKREGRRVIRNVI